MDEFDDLGEAIGKNLERLLGFRYEKRQTKLSNRLDVCK